MGGAALTAAVLYLGKATRISRKGEEKKKKKKKKALKTYLSIDGGERPLNRWASLSRQDRLWYLVETLSS